MTDSRFEYVAENEQDTDRFGEALARSVPDGTVIALRGTLGAGKTRLVQAIATACGIPAATVTSPTFTLIHEYQGDRRLYHIDAYRLESELEFLDLGPDELFDSPAITLIEWADRVRGSLPAQYLDIEIQVTGSSSRRFDVTSAGDELSDTIFRLRGAFQA